MVIFLTLSTVFHNVAYAQIETNQDQVEQLTYVDEVIDTVFEQAEEIITDEEMTEHLEEKKEKIDQLLEATFEEVPQQTTSQAEATVEEVTKRVVAIAYA